MKEAKKDKELYINSVEKELKKRLMSANIQKDNVETDKALAVGMTDTAKEFVKIEAEIYHGNLHKIIYEHH